MPATRRSDGVQQSPVIATVDAEGRVIISSRETAFKTKSLRRDRWAQLCAFMDKFFGLRDSEPHLTWDPRTNSVGLSGALPGT